MPSNPTAQRHEQVQRTSSPRPEWEWYTSFVQLPLHFRKLHQRIGQLLLVVRGIHCCFLILQRVDLLLQRVFLLEQRALGRVVGRLPACAQAQQCKARKEHSLPVSCRAHRFTRTHIDENGMLRSEEHTSELQS